MIASFWYGAQNASNFDRLETPCGLSDIAANSSAHDAAVEETGFDDFFAGIESQINAQTTETEAGFLIRLKDFLFSPAGGTTLILAAVCLFFVMKAESIVEPGVDQKGIAPQVVVEEHETKGKHLIQVSKPLREDEPTVIWLLEGEKDGGVSHDSSVETPF